MRGEPYLVFYGSLVHGTVCMCKRGFGSPRIWIPHPKTLADLDDPKRGFGSPRPADLDPDSQRIVEDLFRQVSMSLAHSD